MNKGCCTLRLGSCARVPSQHCTRMGCVPPPPPAPSTCYTSRFVRVILAQGPMRIFSVSFAWLLLHRKGISVRRGQFPAIRQR